MTIADRGVEAAALSAIQGRRYFRYDDRPPIGATTITVAAALRVTG
jgi:hypothetical protein